MPNKHTFARLCWPRHVNATQTRPVFPRFTARSRISGLLDTLDLAWFRSYSGAGGHPVGRPWSRCSLRSDPKVAYARVGEEDSVNLGLRSGPIFDVQIGRPLGFGSRNSMSLRGYRTVCPGRRRPRGSMRSAIDMAATPRMGPGRNPAGARRSRELLGLARTRSWGLAYR